MSINNWPPRERPREKLLTRGAKTLSDAELLAILINSGTKNRSAIELSYQLLNKFGGLRNIFDANKEQIYKIHGIGEPKKMS